jgi:hypothetical protein
MTVKELPTQRYLVECFDYEADTGRLYWRDRPIHHFKKEYAARAMNKKYAGKEIALFINKGHAYVGVGNKTYAVHRIIWKLVYGTDPGEYIDHVNGDRSDNRIANLREATNAQNQMNQRGRTQVSNTGVVGVNYHKRDRSYRAYMRINNKSKHLGNYKNIEDAIRARLEAEKSYQGEYSPKIHRGEYAQS